MSPMAGDKVSRPTLTLDVHAEVGHAKKPQQPQPRTVTISRNEKRRSDARFYFNKIISSHYRDQSKEYSNVASLFVTWEQNDLLLHKENSEVDQLRSIFNSDLGYKTDAFKIPPEKPEAALNAKVSDFVHKHDDKNALLVLYYAGHGFEDVEDEETGLRIAAIEEGNGKQGDPQAFFPDVMRLLHVAHGDVLLIVDCCSAARAFSRQRHGKRKFELLASSLSMAPAPGQPGSFTAALIKVLRRLLQEPEYRSGVSTSILYRELYHSPELREYKPLLFDQSQFDYGKIWLRPRALPATRLDTTVRTRSETTLDLRLHLSLTKDELMNENRVGLAMNRLAQSLQYLPEVHLIDFIELNAGDAEVLMFLNASRRLTTVKKVIRILKDRVKEKRRKKLEDEAADPKQPLARPPSFAEHLLKTTPSRTLDWGMGVAKLSNGTEIPVKPGPNLPSLQQRTTRLHTHVYQRQRTFWIPGIVYLHYVLDFTGLWNRCFGDDGEDELESGDSDNAKHSLTPTLLTANNLATREKTRHRLPRMLPRERIIWICVVVGILWWRQETSQRCP